MKIGVLGGGQLGRMLALAGYPLGLQFRFLDSSTNSPASHLAPHIVGSYNSVSDLERFAKGVDVATYEFENVPVETARLLNQKLPVYPPPQALEAAQDRLNEKSLFRKLDIPVPDFNSIENKLELQNVLSQFTLPAVVKTRRMGYDGKGQWVVDSKNAIVKLESEIQDSDFPLIIEQKVSFIRELSLLSARSCSGELTFYPLIENRHRGGILQTSIAPAENVTPELQAMAQAYAVRLLETLEYVGVLAIEFFQTSEGLLANEMAPRVHNSGHLTIEGAATSQFENHIRAILDLPLGPTLIQKPTAMINLIGDLPDTRAVLRLPWTNLHLYDKAERPCRKLGHITFTSSTYAQLHERLVFLSRMIARPKEQQWDISNSIDLS